MVATPPADASGAYVSYPRAGKHLAFSGTLLHGCPHHLSVGNSGAAGEGGRRVTFLVNLWRRHQPRGPQRLPQRVLAELANVADNGRGAFLADTLPPACSAAQVDATGTSATQRFAPSAERKRTSPAARAVSVRGLPGVVGLEAAASHLVHAPRALVVDDSVVPSGTDVAVAEAAGPMFTVVGMGAAKDLGVLASRPLEDGEVLIREAPLLRLTPDGQGRYDGAYPAYGGDRERCRGLLTTLSMHSCGKRGMAASELERVIETNGFVVEGGHATVVFETIARLNHSCVSNARFEWDAATGTGAVHVKKQIGVGEEITINYGATGTRDQRQRHLAARFGFDCACVRCEAEGGTAQASPPASLPTSPPPSPPPSPPASPPASPATSPPTMPSLDALMTWPPIVDLERRWRRVAVIREATERAGRPWCCMCARPARVCVCDALPSNGELITPEVPIVLLQHPREATRNFSSTTTLQLCLAASRLSVVVGRSLSAARRSEGWLRAVREGRTPLLMYPKEGASDAMAVRARMGCGERFFFVVIDGTWSEAKEMLDKGDGGSIECFALAPETHDDGVGVYGGCRKPIAPGCFCTLEAVALALRAFDPRGAELSHALLRPLLKQVDHQMVACDGRQAHHPWRPGYIPDLHAAAQRVAVRAGVATRAWASTPSGVGVDTVAQAPAAESLLDVVQLHGPPPVGV